MKGTALLLLLPLFVLSSPQCNLPNNNTATPNPPWDSSNLCTADSFNNLGTPPFRNLTTSGGESKHDCGIMIILDLDTGFTSDINFLALQQFMKEMVNNCQARGVGNLVIFNKLFNDTFPPYMCCDGVSCEDVIDGFRYEDFVDNYDSMATVQSDTASNNFTITFLDDIKQLSYPSAVCLYNTVVLITNRIFNYSVKLDIDSATAECFSCETVTIIGVGNNITFEVMKTYYGSLTPNRYVLADLDCLADLVDCIKPCGGLDINDCQNFQNKGGCPVPTTTKKPTTWTAVPSAASSRRLNHIKLPNAKLSCGCDSLSWDPSDYCTPSNFSNLQAPPIRNFTTAAGNLTHDCGIVFILDLDAKYTSKTDFQNVQQFMKALVKNCQIRAVGGLVIFNKLFNDVSPPNMCCDGTPCDTTIDNLQYENFMDEYQSSATVQNGTDANNFTIAFLLDLKQLSPSPASCLFNTVVMISSRLFIPYKDMYRDVEPIVSYSCETITIIGVGNNITSELMKTYYESITPNQIVLPDFASLPALADNIKPCDGSPEYSCLNYPSAPGCQRETPVVPPTPPNSNGCYFVRVEVFSWIIALYIFS